MIKRIKVTGEMIAAGLAACRAAGGIDSYDPKGGDYSETAAMMFEAMLKASPDFSDALVERENFRNNGFSLFV